jgi:hypothetical protein
MTFNAGKFEATQFIPRTTDVPVPGLSDYFDSPDAAVWTVRGLTGEELAQVEEHVERSAMAGKMIGMAGASSEQVKNAVEILLGATKDTPRGHVKLLRMFEAGTVSPKVDYQTVVKLAMHFPVEFRQIANEVLRLTGLGSNVKKKPNSSTETSESETP